MADDVNNELAWLDAEAQNRRSKAMVGALKDLSHPDMLQRTLADIYLLMRNDYGNVLMEKWTNGVRSK